MRKVGVIGLGHVGSTVAYTLVTKGIADELVLIDTNEAKCTAEFYDLLDSLGRLDTYTKLSMNDYKALQDADVVITAFGDIKALADGGNRFLEYSFNCQQAKQVGTALKEAGFHGVLINISNPCDVITGLLQHYTGLSRQQVFGTGTFLDTARMQRAVSMSLDQTRTTLPVMFWVNTENLSLPLGRQLPFRVSRSLKSPKTSILNCPN